MKKINGSYKHKFKVSQEGLYSITIEASCEKGSELKVEIDEIKLREVPAKDKVQYYNIPPSWNGSQLKGTSKIVILVLNLFPGEHSLKFESIGEAELVREPQVALLEKQGLITILENIQSPKKDRQPWITIALIDLPLIFLDISASCKKRFLDSDDIKLIIDGNIQKHPDSIWWGKNWLWQGRLLKGLTESRRIYQNLSKDIHYIEFWADVTPTLNSLHINLGEESGIKIDPGTKETKKWGKIALYKDIIEAGITYLKYLFDIYNNSTDYYKKVTAAWNAGQSVIPIKGPISYDKIGTDEKKKEVQDLVKRVDINRKKKDWKRIILSLLIFPVSCLLFDKAESLLILRFFTIIPKVKI